MSSYPSAKTFLHGCEIKSGRGRGAGNEVNYTCRQPFFQSTNSSRALSRILVWGRRFESPFHARAFMFVILHSRFTFVILHSRFISRSCIRVRDLAFAFHARAFEFVILHSRSTLVHSSSSRILYSSWAKLCRMDPQQQSHSNILPVDEPITL